MYRYNATVVYVVDADTIDLDIDLGFYMTARIRVRLARIDAWETRGEERSKGLTAKSFVEALLADRRVQVFTEKTGKYGRWIAEVYLLTDQLGLHGNLSDILVEHGHAEYMEY